MPRSTSKPISLAAPRKAAELIISITVVLAALSQAALGHDVFTSYIQHRIAITAGARHIDVAVELTFFEDSSEHERQHMDTNGDGLISHEEQHAYLSELEPKLTRAVELRLGPQTLSLSSLREPQLDLLGNNRVGRGHHRLTLWFFAPTPTDIKAGAELSVADQLWPKARALGALHAMGINGCKIKAVPPDDPLFPPARDGEARQFKARFLAPPLADLTNTQQ
jgi:hypothetical protein